MIRPLISICIPVYNGEKYLRDCLDSALAQTYQNTEIIIVDDRSTDNSVSIIHEYVQKDGRIKYFFNDNNLGLVGNWNRCMDLAKGEWIKFLFQDDLLNKNCIQRMIECAVESIDLIVCNREFIFDQDVSDEIRKTYLANMVSLQKKENLNKPIFIDAKKIAALISDYLTVNFIGEPTVVMFRKSVFNKLGNFNPSLVQICDLEYWLRIASDSGFFYIPETLAFFRIHSRSVSAINRLNNKGLVDNIVLMFEYLNGQHYQKLRNNLSDFSLKKMNDVLKLRIYEVFLRMKNNPGLLELKSYYSQIKKVIPEIAVYERFSLRTKLIYFLVSLKRRIS